MVTKEKLALFKAALLRSGYLLENRLETALRDAHWVVEANNVYKDAAGDPHELDIHAMIARPFGPVENGQSRNAILAHVLVECVNNPEPVALLTKEPQVRYVAPVLLKTAGVPHEIRGDGEGTPMATVLRPQGYHHYFNSRIATQYLSFSRKKQKPQDPEEWMATHVTEQYEVFSKLPVALEYMRQSIYSPLGAATVRLFYPVVALQGELLDARPTRRSVSLKRASHLLYRESSIAGGTEGYYNIDVVTERFFPRFINLVEEELTRAAGILHGQFHEIENTLARMFPRPPVAGA